MDAYAKPLCDFADRVPTLRHLIDRCDLEFFSVSFAAHTYSFSLELWLKSVYRSRGDSVWQKDRASIDWDRAGKSNRHSMVLNGDSVYGLSSKTKGRLWLLMTPRSARRSATGLERMEAPRSACKVSSPGASPAWGHVPCSAEPSPRPPAVSCSNASCTILHDATAPQRQLDCCTHRLRARCAACSWL
jgi:hypothetical protein